MTFDVNKEKQALKEQTKAIRKRVYKKRKSRLDRYKGEILALHNAQVTPTEIKRWLRAKRIKVVLTTVIRWLEKNGSLS
ncbi:hypothetical protein MTZ49_15710 (plasmid) [Entomomonas sp. E2T0]|uniref:hypothetical protein n=1 Tax=Entomomonas sp. E2T0 TaxID=2930213 RepID=UPI0022281B79|nr:hypothetical protein [Entomomonas sp. E2T0]UYZ85596.1 hypothetical protein MTZ49_15710 [Entomomonas sp. E2T0]